jgi:site-specific DNA recombinase
MANAVVYTRVSTEEQAKTGLSLENQEKACIDFAERSGHKVLEVFREEGVSAKTANRKELHRLLNYCRTNKGSVDALIVWKVDRFARRAEDHLMLKALLIKFNVQLLSVTEPIEDTNTGRLMETVLAAFAQFDNEVRAERSKGGTYARIEQGGWPFYAPIGYENIKDSLGRPTLKKDLQLAPLINLIFNE